MAPRPRSAGDENDAPEVLVGSETPVIVPDPEAAETGGAKMIRCRHNDEFVVDGDTKVTGAWTQFPAAKAKAVIEAAERNGVRLAVADVEKKG
jgi:hypothetical protein